MPIQAPKSYKTSFLAAGFIFICNFSNPVYADVMSEIAARPAWAVSRTVAPSEIELKRQFAEYLLYNPYDHEGAAREVYRTNFARAAIAEREWPFDPVVIEHKKKLIAECGERHFLPTRETIVHNLWHKVRRDPTLENKDMIATVRLISELSGFIGKASDLAGNESTITNQTISINFVEPERKENVKVIEGEMLPDLNLKFAS